MAAPSFAGAQDLTLLTTKLYIPPPRSNLVPRPNLVQRLDEGLTNQEIASRLYLALNTIKVHTHNIYGKLGVSNRTQAGTRARALEILPPV